MDKIKLEVCAVSVASCIEAERGGAVRVELCAGMPEGGTTPSYGEISLARESINIGLNVIIRPRGGDFLYSPLEVKTMKADIIMAKLLGADGVVFGCLTPEGDVDKEMCSDIMKDCWGLSTTFHRAFDVCRDPHQALEDIIELGFDRILTSGCKPTAPEGKELLKELVRQAAGRIIIMPGSGVKVSNIKELCDYTGAREFHSSARSAIHSTMQYRSESVSFGGTVELDDFVRGETNSQIVSEMVGALKH